MIVFNEIFDSFGESEKISVYTDGESKTYGLNTAEFKEILVIWNEMTKGARQMPAFGVSLNGETEKAIKNGLWLEFSFAKMCECSGMSFEKLLVEVKGEYTGFNVIRFNSVYGYDGRCYYIDLVGNNMVKLHQYLSDL